MCFLPILHVPFWVEDYLHCVCTKSTTIRLIFIYFISVSKNRLRMISCHVLRFWCRKLRSTMYVKDMLTELGNACFLQIWWKQTWKNVELCDLSQFNSVYGVNRCTLDCFNHCNQTFILIYQLTIIEVNLLGWCNIRSFAVQRYFVLTSTPQSCLKFFAANPKIGQTSTVLYTAFISVTTTI